MPSKHSQHELKRLVEAAVADVCGLPRTGLWFCTDLVQARGRPPEHLTVWATLHFVPEGSPFCCGEPGCHLWLFGDRLRDVGDHLRRAMRLRQEVAVEFSNIGVNYHSGVTFHYGQIGQQ
jgi:hypothetical protein